MQREEKGKKSKREEKGTKSMCKEVTPLPGDLWGWLLVRQNAPGYPTKHGNIFAWG